MKKFCFLILFVYLPVSIFSQSQNRLTVREFFENPFQSNVIMPKIFYPYNSFEEIFDIIGIPKNRTRLNIPKSYNMGEHTYDFQYEYFNIGVVYIEARNVVYISYLWITLREDVEYTFDIRKNDNLEKIENIFGRTNSVNDLNNGLLEFSYYYDNLFGSLSFQFEDDNLRSIIIWCWD